MISAVAKFILSIVEASSTDVQTTRDMWFLISCFLRHQSGHSLVFDDLERIRVLAEDSETHVDQESEIVSESVAAPLEPMVAEIAPTTKPKPKAEKKKLAPKPAASATEDLLAPIGFEFEETPAPVAPAHVAPAHVAPAHVPSATEGSIDAANVLRFDLTKLNTTKCMGRSKGKDVPHTAPKMSCENQCNKKPLDNDRLCNTCKRNQEYFLTKNKDKNYYRDWHGYIDGEMMEHSQFYGGKWFAAKYKKGLSSETLAALNIQSSVTSTTTASAVATSDVTSAPSAKPNVDTSSVVSEETLVTENEIQESVADETAAVVTEEWRPYAHQGINYVWNVKTRKVYTADLSKPFGAEMKTDNYCGRFINGMLDYTIAEDEDME